MNRYTLMRFVPLGLLCLSLLALPSCDSSGGNDNGGEPPPDAPDISALRITEVNEQDGWVELVNTGNETVDISEAWLCANRVYERLNALTVAAGDLMLDSGERVAVEWDRIAAGDGDLGIYLSGTENPGGFSNADQIVDYLRWGEGAGDTGRQGVAVDAGIWTEGDAVSAAADGATISFFGDDPASNDAVADWGDGEPTPGDANAPFEGGGNMNNQSNVRITEVNEQDGWVELINTGNEAVDVSEVWLCANRVYERLNALTVAAGDLMLDSGERVAVEWDQISAGDGDLGIYLSGTENPGGFGNADQIVDYLRWGEGAGNAGRQGTAVDAGIWTEGDAMSAAADGATISFFGDDPASNDTVTDWGDGEPTPADANSELGSASLSDLRITEVSEGGQWFEIVNTGAGPVEVDLTELCANFVYEEIQDVSVEAFDENGDADLMLAAGEYLAVNWGEIDADNGDLGIYLSGTSGGGEFGNPDNLVDYVRWGPDGADREDVAVDAGIWTQGDFVSSAASGMSFSFVGDNARNNDDVSDWEETEPTPAAPNSTSNSTNLSRF